MAVQQIAKQKGGGGDHGGQAGAGKVPQLGHPEIRREAKAVALPFCCGQQHAKLQQPAHRRQQGKARQGEPVSRQRQNGAQRQAVKQAQRALQGIMLQRLQKRQQQIGEQDHGQRRQKRPEAPAKQRRALSRQQRGQPRQVQPLQQQRQPQAAGHGRGDQPVGRRKALLPAPAEPLGENGHGGHAEGVGHRGKQGDGIIVGQREQVHLRSCAKGAGLQDVAQHRQQLGRQHHGRHAGDGPDGFLVRPHGKTPFLWRSGRSALTSSQVFTIIKYHCQEDL